MTEWAMEEEWKDELLKVIERGEEEEQVRLVDSVARLKRWERYPEEVEAATQVPTPPDFVDEDKIAYEQEDFDYAMLKELGLIRPA